MNSPRKVKCGEVYGSKIYAIAKLWVYVKTKNSTESDFVFTIPTLPPFNLEQAWPESHAAFLEYLNELTAHRLATLRLATLGPAGTPSAALAATLLATTVKTKKFARECVLCESYERAFAGMLVGESDLFLVENSYEGAFRFYHSPRALLLLSFTQALPRPAHTSKTSMTSRRSWSLFAPAR